MWDLGFIAFLSPWFLLALIVLPVLWHIVRFTPPAPKHIDFPAIRLLRFLKQKEDTPRRAPWWLLALRIGMIVVAILAAAHPVLHPEQKLSSHHAIILVIDNNWSSSDKWPQINSQASQILEIAQRQEKSVQIVTTAPDPDAPYHYISNVMSASEAGLILKSLRPLPWGSRYDLLMRELNNQTLAANPDIFWFSSGLAGDGFDDFVSVLRKAGQVTLITDAQQPVLLLSAKMIADGQIEMILRQSVFGDQDLPQRSYSIHAYGDDGKVLGQQDIIIPTKQNVGKAKLDLPLDIINRIGRLSLESSSGAGSTYLMDAMTRQHPVGLVTTQAMDTSKPFLDEYYFIERAITPFADIFRGSVEEILKSSVAVIILTDQNVLTEIERGKLQEWIESGGMLIRFAGENIVKNKDSLTPVPILEQPRNLSGSLSWSDPLSLAAMPDFGPFAGLKAPEDVKVNRQLLTAPTPDLAAKSWATLQDGTPLVTGMQMGKGQLALFHIAANSNWSNLILSGLFVEMLQRLVWSSQGIVAESADGNLGLLQMLDGFGQLQSPPPYSQSAPFDELQTKRISPAFPPGYYGSASDKHAFNVGDHVAAMESITNLPQDIKIVPDLQSREKDLRTWFYLFLMILALVDTIISFNIRGFFPSISWRWPGKAALVLFCMFPMMAQAADHVDQARHLRLAYVRTNIGELDRTSQAGLYGLSQVLRQRTAIEIADPIAVDLDSDEISFYPLIYWPISTSASKLSPIAAIRISNYLRNGGMMVIDTRDGSGSGIAQNLLAEYFQALELPVLSPIGPDHVLTRSFYLLKEWPGRWNDKTLWLVDSESSSFDGVSPIIVGTQDWAAAWAVDKAGKPLFPLVPGGEGQRETARRFGVNLVMYALTGNYKSDQVHVPAILQRLRHEQ